MDANGILILMQDKIPNDPAIIMSLREKLERMSDEERNNFSLKLSALI